jgi:hypothetical protein
MPLDSKDVDVFLSLTRQKRAAAERPKSKLEAQREAIMAAVAEGLPITSIREVLAEHCGLKVSYANLREWIHRQPEFRKGKGAIKKPLTKEQKAAWERLKNRDPNEPLTLEKK